MFGAFVVSSHLLWSMVVNFRLDLYGAFLHLDWVYESSINQSTLLSALAVVRVRMEDRLTNVDDRNHYKSITMDQYNCLDGLYSLCNAMPPEL